MKKMKRFIAIAAAIAVLAVSSAAPAFAAGTPTGTPTGTLTMQDLKGYQKTTSSYSAYQIATFDADTLNGKTVFTNMKLNAKNGTAYREAIINNIPGIKKDPLDDQLFSALSQVKDNAQEVIDLADALAAVAAKIPKPDYSAPDGKFSSLPYGYYLVLETANNAGDGTVISKPILICVPDSKNGEKNVSVKVKTSYATIQKKIVETDPNNKNQKIYVDTNTTSIDKDVDYRSLSTFPTYSKNATGINYTVTDTFSKGLTFDTKKNKVEVDIVDANLKTVQTLQEGTDYSLTPSLGTDGSTIFKLTLINKDKEISEWGKNSEQLQILYSATLNKGANTGAVGNPNSVKLTYTVKPGDSAVPDYTTPEDTVITYTYKLIITKVDSDCECQPLQGAEFSLYKDGSQTAVESEGTDEKGIATFTKLEQGDYTLVETKAPKGYNLPSEPIKFNLIAQNKDNSRISNELFDVAVNGNKAAQESVSATWILKKGTGNCTFSQTDAAVLGAEIPNFPGFVLPGTGGIGTVIFTVGGIAILLVGCCMAFLYFRKKKKSERQ